MGHPQCDHFSRKLRLAENSSATTIELSLFSCRMSMAARRLIDSFRLDAWLAAFAELASVCRSQANLGNQFECSDTPTCAVDTKGLATRGVPDERVGIGHTVFGGARLGGPSGHKHDRDSQSRNQTRRGAETIGWPAGMRFCRGPVSK